MGRQTSTGVWLASVGAALQLVGLSWDGILHHLDPDLAAREEVFTLANPSHLLVVFGLGLTVAGLVWLLLLSSRSAGAAGHPERWRLLAGATLSLLLVGMAGVGIATGQVVGEHSHSHADGEADPLRRAAGGSNVTATPAFAQLQQDVRERGVTAALDRLEQLAATDPAILAVAHDYAHSIGKYAFEYYGNAPTAFGQCRETFQSGCYHGVLESYLERNPQLTPGEIADLCDVSIAPNAASVLRFQCLHGLGHGLTGNLEHDIFRALRMCDVLRGEWDRGSCYSGVFMENIIFATDQLAGGDEAHQHDHGSGHRFSLDPKDPLYPCDVVDERYKPECFVMQTSAILMFNGYDFGQALVECDRAPRQYIHLCYQSIGRDVSSYTYRDPGKSLQMCLHGQAAYQGYCLLGAAKNMIDVTWQIDQALELCGGAPKDYKSICYTAIGEQLANLHPDPDDRERECRRSEPDYVPSCARGAGLVLSG